jgi:predicted nucleic-acid-binding Zn-ribbon protein
MPDHGQEADDWFEAKGVQLRCTQCGGQQFSGGRLIPLHAPSPDEPDEEMWVYTLLPLMCENCGHFEFFSAELMGLVPP